MASLTQFLHKIRIQSYRESRIKNFLNYTILNIILPFISPKIYLTSREKWQNKIISTILQNKAPENEERNVEKIAITRKLGKMLAISINKKICQ